MIYETGNNKTCGLTGLCISIMGSLFSRDVPQLREEKSDTLFSTFFLHRFRQWIGCPNLVVFSTFRHSSVGKSSVMEYREDCQEQCCKNVLIYFIKVKKNILIRFFSSLSRKSTVSLFSTVQHLQKEVQQCIKYFMDVPFHIIMFSELHCTVVNKVWRHP